MLGPERAGYISGPFRSSRPNSMLRLGILDFDSSHCVEFTRRLNRVGVTADQFVDGARVVLGCPGTSLMAPERIQEFTPALIACGVEIADRETVLNGVDAVLVLSLCGSAHGEGACAALGAGRPTFVDKPFAVELADCRRMLAVANEKSVPVHYASAMRFSDELLGVPEAQTRWGAIHGAACHGPAKLHSLNPGLFHYGIHTVEILYTLLGPGCERVVTTTTEDADVVSGVWQDGRIGTVRGIRRGSTAYGATLFCEGGVVSLPLSATNSYRNLMRALVRRLHGGEPLVPPDVILEETAFVLAALESQRRGGLPVRLTEILDT